MPEDALQPKQRRVRCRCSFKRQCDAIFSAHARTRSRKSGTCNCGRPRATSNTVASSALGQLPGRGSRAVCEAGQGIIEVVGYNEVVHHFSAYESGID
jgi:hypothetical protein